MKPMFYVTYTTRNMEDVKKYFLNFQDAEEHAQYMLFFEDCINVTICPMHNLH